MKRKLQGKYVKTTTPGEAVKAFVPAPLPPKPDIVWSTELRQQFELAHLALGRLDSVASLLPDTQLFLYMYVRKEAVLSSMIEGTQSSLSDLLIFELEQQPGVPLDDVQEVSNYVAALNHGLERLSEGLPLSLRLFKEMHAILLSKGRGGHKQPGEIRQSQNWIGGTRPGNAVYVPPPPGDLPGALSALEKFIHDDPVHTPTLLKAALVHLQFESIHPFLDGNGRLGRLLIILILSSEGILQKPLLYLSLYLKTHRQAYYELLNSVRETGDWESWLLFFAEAVEETANSAVETVRRLKQQIQHDSVILQQQGRTSHSLVRLHQSLVQRPIATPASLEESSGLARATVQSCLNKMEELEIIEEITGRQRDRVYAYKQYISILSEGDNLP